MQIDACLDKIPIGVDVITIRNRNDLENGFPKPTKIMDARCGHLGAADIDDQSLNDRWISFGDGTGLYGKVGEGKLRQASL